MSPECSISKTKRGQTTVSPKRTPVRKSEYEENYSNRDQYRGNEAKKNEKKLIVFDYSFKIPYIF